MVKNGENISVNREDIFRAKISRESIEKCEHVPRNNASMHCGSRLEPVRLLDWEKDN